MARMNRCILMSVLLAALMGGANGAFAQELDLACGNVSGTAQSGGYGPFDYRTDKSKLGVVEAYHFDAGVESLTRGKTGAIEADIAYTLNVFPNHHRALMAMMNLGVRERKAKLPGAAYSVECYMYRAERFRPDDGMVKVIYGLFHLKNGRPQQALTKLEAGAKLDSQNANVQYNLGLAYFDLKQYDKSLQSARRAYALGFPLAGLRDKLKRAGKWSESGPAPAATVDPSKPSAESVVEGK